MLPQAEEARGHTPVEEQMMRSVADNQRLDGVGDMVPTYTKHQE